MIHRQILSSCQLVMTTFAIAPVTGALGQSSQPLLSVNLTQGSGYSYGCCDSHLWPSLSFSVRDIAVTSTSTYATATVNLHIETSRTNPFGWSDVSSIASFDVNVRGNPGDHYRVLWSCFGRATGSGYVPGSNLPTVFYQGCGNPGAQGNFDNASQDSGIRSGTLSGGTPGGSHKVTSFGHWISLSQGGHRSADWTVNVVVEIVRPNPRSPTARIVGPSTASENVQVSYDGSTSLDPDGTIEEYRWTMQHSNGFDTLFSPVIQYDWSVSGTYLVTLAVTDNDGLTASTNLVVTVFPPKACAVDPLTPIPILVQQYPELYPGSTLGLEANPIDSFHLQPNMQTALACFQGRIQGAGGTFRLNSAYRTNAYQAHLREVWDKWIAIKPLAGDPTCSQVYADVQSEFDKHGIVHRPASADLGPHTTGSAIDVCADGIARRQCSTSIPNSVLSSTQTLAIADQCGLHRRVPTDPVHFEHK